MTVSVSLLSLKILTCDSKLILKILTRDSKLTLKILTCDSKLTLKILTCDSKLILKILTHDSKLTLNTLTCDRLWYCHCIPHKLFSAPRQKHAANACIGGLIKPCASLSRHQSIALMWPRTALNDFIHSNSAFSKFTELILCLLGPSCPPIKHIESNQIELKFLLNFHLCLCWKSSLKLGCRVSKGGRLNTTRA